MRYTSNVPSPVSVHPGIQLDVRLLRSEDTALIHPANGTKYTFEAVKNEQKTETNHAILYGISTCKSDHSKVIRSVNYHHFLRMDLVNEIDEQVGLTTRKPDTRSHPQLQGKGRADTGEGPAFLINRGQR
jgi:hypothetical protein